MIEYNKFEEYMLLLEGIFEEEYQLNSALKRISPDFGGFSNEGAIELILSLLKEITHDECDNIEYFIYELKWGKKWHKGCVTDRDGKDIPMGTIKELYNCLKENYDED